MILQKLWIVICINTKNADYTLSNEKTTSWKRMNKRFWTTSLTSEMNELVVEDDLPFWLLNEKRFLSIEQVINSSHYCASLSSFFKDKWLNKPFLFWILKRMILQSISERTKLIVINDWLMFRAVNGFVQKSISFVCSSSKSWLRTHCNHYYPYHWQDDILFLLRTTALTERWL